MWGRYRGGGAEGRLSKNRTWQCATIQSPFFSPHFHFPFPLHRERAGNPRPASWVEELNWLNLLSDSLFVWFPWKLTKRTWWPRKSQAVYPKEQDDYRLCSAKNTAVQLSGVHESILKWVFQKDVPKPRPTRKKASSFAYDEANS